MTQPGRVLRIAYIYYALTCPKLYKEGRRPVADAVAAVQDACPYAEAKSFARLMGR